jgi:nucleotide-binding universal stress UspA family protein
MYDSILFPTDGSEPAGSVLEYAVDVASEHGATLHVLSVADASREDVGRAGEEAMDAPRLAAQEIVDDAASRAREGGVSVVSAVREGDPSAAIVEYGDASGVELVVMPTHGRHGLKRFLLGSVTERVINTADVPVVAVNPDRERPLRYPPANVLVPTDGSAGAERALSEAIAVTRATGATLHLLHVVETGRLGPDARAVLDEAALTERADEIVAGAVEAARAESLDAVESAVEFGVPSKEIRRYSEANAIDLAVLGTQGETDFSRYVMGGVSAKIVRTSPVPVMWVG